MQPLFPVTPLLERPLPPPLHCKEVRIEMLSPHVHRFRELPRPASRTLQTACSGGWWGVGMTLKAPSPGSYSQSKTPSVVTCCSQHESWVTWAQGLGCCRFPKSPKHLKREIRKPDVLGKQLTPPSGASVLCPGGFRTNSSGLGHSMENM